MGERVGEVGFAVVFGGRVNGGEPGSGSTSCKTKKSMSEHWIIAEECTCV